MRVQIGYEDELFIIRIWFDDGRYAQAKHLKAWGAYECMTEVLNEQDRKAFRRWFKRHFGVYEMDAWLAWQRISRDWRQGRYAHTG